MRVEYVNNVEDLYDTYSPLMYGIALKISRNENEAEEILVRTFQKIYRENLIQQDSYCTCATIIKLTIQTARELLKQVNSIEIRQFEDTPLLHLLLFEQVSMEDYCQVNNLLRSQAEGIIHEEFKHIRTISHKQKEVKKASEFLIED